MKYSFAFRGGLVSKNPNSSPFISAYKILVAQFISELLKFSPKCIPSKEFWNYSAKFKILPEFSGLCPQRKFDPAKKTGPHTGG